jgi:Homeodomain-like domain
MKTASAEPRSMPLARRALIVQRVLVDGWTSAKAAATFGISERLVDVWVADYRRHGMAGLRRIPGKIVALEILHLAIGGPIRGAARRIANGLRRLFVQERLPQPLPLRRSNDDRHGGE